MDYFSNRIVDYLSDAIYNLNSDALRTNASTSKMEIGGKGTTKI